MLQVMLIYTVTVHLPSQELLQEVLDWLEDDHLAQVVEAGAEDGEATVLDGDEYVVEVRYRFASREAFAVYEAGPASALRSEGARFIENGARFERTIGTSTIRRG